MLRLARKLNSEVTYIQVDMRNVKLDTRFDAVVILDSIDYNRTVEDTRVTFGTVFRHLNVGGVFLTVIEYNKDTFPHNHTTVSTHQKGGIDIIFIENNYDPDPQDTQFEITFVFLVCKNGKLEIHTDQHLLGLFKTETWVNKLKGTGFDVIQLKFVHFTFKKGDWMPMLVGIKPTQ